MNFRSPIRVSQVVRKMNGCGVETVLMNYDRNIDRSCAQFDFLVDMSDRGVESIVKNYYC